MTIVFRYLGDNVKRCLLLPYRRYYENQGGRVSYKSVHFILISIRTFRKTELLTRKLAALSGQVYITML